MAAADRNFSSLTGQRAVGQKKRFGVFRLTSVIALVATAIWFFMGGPNSRLPYDRTPDWLLETPSWILGSAALGLAVLAAVLPAEKIEDLIFDFLGAKEGREADGRGLGHHGITELGLSSYSNAEKHVERKRSKTQRSLSDKSPKE